ncbi:hypothetical protein [Barrientosiimonas endolithica]|uniref:hypothetical protein n=1 Tax=Barrientosiimonas endolithica TaxID=1535208 RepID=UPI00259B9097|nr:hypothetical protein [Barrientosiimonas endolithica]
MPAHPERGVDQHRARRLEGGSQQLDDALAQHGVCRAAVRSASDMRSSSPRSYVGGAW